MRKTMKINLASLTPEALTLVTDKLTTGRTQEITWWLGGRKVRVAGKRLRLARAGHVPSLI